MTAHRSTGTARAGPGSTSTSSTGGWRRPVDGSASTPRRPMGSCSPTCAWSASSATSPGTPPSCCAAATCSRSPRCCGGTRWTCSTSSVSSWGRRSPSAGRWWPASRQVRCSSRSPPVPRRWRRATRPTRWSRRRRRGRTRRPADVDPVERWLLQGARARTERGPGTETRPTGRHLGTRTVAGQVPASPPVGPADRAGPALGPADAPLPGPRLPEPALGPRRRGRRDPAGCGRRPAAPRTTTSRSSSRVRTSTSRRGRRRHRDHPAGCGHRPPRGRGDDIEIVQPGADIDLPADGEHGLPPAD
jgi:hypothetical protein